VKMDASAAGCARPLEKFVTGFRTQAYIAYIVSGGHRGLAFPGSENDPRNV
jgi:hypothetical protein